MPAAAARQSDIRPQPDHIPLAATTGMRFAHSDNITKRQIGQHAFDYTGAQGGVVEYACAVRIILTRCSAGPARSPQVLCKTLDRERAAEAH